MISNHKALLHVFEITALLCGPLSLLLGIMGITGLIAPQPLSVLVMPEMLLMFAVFFMALVLVVEYTRLTRANKSIWKRFVGVDWKEIRHLVTWCPTWIIYAALALIVVAIATLYPGGEVKWSPGDPFEARHLSLIVGPSLFMLISLPVIATARRMPGSFADVLRDGLIT